MPGVIYMNIDGRIITPDNFYALYVEGVAPLSPAQGAAMPLVLGAIPCHK